MGRPVVEPQKIRFKEPIELDAMRVDAEHFEALPRWLGARFWSAGRDSNGVVHVTFESATGAIATARTGDWVVRGVTGAFFVVPDGAFGDRYEVVPPVEAWGGPK